MAGNLTAMIAAAFSGGAAPPVTSDPYYEYTTLLLPGNGTNGAQNNTFLDGSTNNFTITRNGNTTQGTFSPFSQTGWGNYFDGTGDYLSVPDNAAFTMGSGDFTIEFWAYTTTTNNQTAIVQIDSGGSTSALSFGVQINTSKWRGILASGTTFYACTASANAIANQWNHIAFVRNGNTGTLYINGTADGTVSLTGVTINDSSQVVAIGGEISGSSMITGYISNARIVKGTAVYTSNFTPSTTPLTPISGTSLLTCQSNRFIDNSSNNFTITVNGNTSVVAFSPFNPSASWSAATYGGSGYFDGSGDYLQGPVNSAFAFGTGEYCMEGWIYMTSAPASPSGLIDLRRAAPNYNAPWLNVTSGYKLALRDGTLGVDVVTGATNIQLNTWTHVAVTRQVTSNAGTRIFLNGVLDANSITNNSNYSNGALTLATAGDSLGSFMFTGYMSDVRITKGSVPTSYQTSATTSGTAVFTPPTSPETTTSQGASSPSILLNFTNAGIYDATSKNDLETVGNAQISTTQSKWSGSSMYFDGNGDQLLAPSSVYYVLGTGDFTVELWAYSLDTGSSLRGIVDFRTAASGTNGILLRENSGGFLVATGSTTSLSTTTGRTANAWQHIALVRSSGTLSLYVGGSLQTSTAYSTNLTDNALRISGFVDTSASPYAYYGYMQDLRISKYARYTTNFTPPTAAFPTL